MNPVQRNVPLSAQIAGHFRELIGTGALPVGAKLAPEHEIARDMDVSRNSVREALRSLVHSGLIEARAGDGTYVRAQSELQVALARQASRGRADDVVELRSLLERFGARMAAARATPEDVAAIKEALDQRNDSPDGTSYVRNDLAFHRAVVASSHNELLAELYRNFDEVEAHMLRVIPADERFGQFVANIAGLNETHRQLFLAIEARDADAAEHAAGALVQEAHELPSVSTGRDPAALNSTVLSSNDPKGETK